MRISTLAAATSAIAALALAGCSATLPTASERGTDTITTEAAGATAAVLNYKTTPTTKWTTTLGQAGDGFGSDATFSSPWIPWEMMELPMDPSPLVAGTVWVTAAGESLLGLDPDTGERLWTYRPGDGSLTGCSATPIDQDLVCTVSDALTDAMRSAVVLVDVTTGTEASRFDLPFPSRAVDVAGSDVVVVMYTGPIPFPYDAPQSLPENPYRVSRYAVDGTEAWTAEIPYVLDDFACSPCTEAGVELNTSLVDTWIRGQSFLLDSDDGALLWQGNEWHQQVTLTRDGAVLTRSSDDGTRRDITVLGADGSTLASLPDDVLLTDPVAVDDDEPLTLMNADREVVELDPISGATKSTGVTLPTDAGEPFATRIGDYLFLGGLAYDLRQPETPAWQSPQLDTRVPSGDGDLLYALHTEGDAGTARTGLTAVQVADGATLWTLPLAEPEAPSGDPRLGTADGHLIIVDGPTMTVLQP